MSIQSFILVLTIIFVIVIFIALPIGIHMPKNIQKGHADSAPANPNIGFKLMISLMISLVLTIIFCYIIKQ